MLAESGELKRIFLPLAVSVAVPVAGGFSADTLVPEAKSTLPGEVGTTEMPAGGLLRTVPVLGTVFPITSEIVPFVDAEVEPTDVSRTAPVLKVIVPVLLGFRS
jgi:hypothetical protein